MPTPNELDQAFIAKIKSQAPVTPLKGITNQRVDQAMLKLPPQVNLASTPDVESPELTMPQTDYVSKVASQEPSRGWEIAANIFGALGGRGPGAGTELINKQSERDLKQAELRDATDPNSLKSQMFRDLATRLGVPISATHSAAQISDVISPYQNLYNQDSRLASLMAKLNAKKNGLPSNKPVLTGKPLEEVENLRSSLNDLNQVRDILKTTGAQPGKMNALKSFYNQSSFLPGTIDADKVSPLNTAQGMINQAYGKLISGGAISKEEQKRFEQTLPQPSDSPALFEQKYNTFMKMLESKLGSKLDTYELNNMDVNRFRPGQQQNLNITKKPTPQTGWTSEKEKRYQELKAKAGK